MTPDDAIEAKCRSVERHEPEITGKTDQPAADQPPAYPAAADVAAADYLRRAVVVTGADVLVDTGMVVDDVLGVVVVTTTVVEIF